MSVITHLLNKSVVIQRLSSSGTDKMACLTVTAGVPCHIQTSSPGKSGLTEGVYGKQFRIYVDTSASILQGDRLRDSDGNLYTVISDGVTTKSYGSIDYKIVVCQKTK